MIKDEVLGLCELTNDLLYQKIPKQEILYYIQESLKQGYVAAQEYKGLDILEVCKKNKIEIAYIKENKKMYGVSFRAQVEMSEKQTKIWIYKGALRDLAQSSSYEGRKKIDYEDALRIHVCHEYFHYLEYQQKRFVSESLPDVITFQLLGMKRRAKINRCSEIAAHAFAKEILELEELPNIYDYFYLINSKQMKAKQFEDMVGSYNSILNL